MQPPSSSVPPAAIPSNLRGVAFMALGFAAFAASDAVAKLMTQDFEPVQIVWFRTLGLVLGVLVLLARVGRPLMHSPHPRLQIARGVVATISATAFILGIRYVPLADAVAVSFVAPFMVTIAAAIVLREPVGWRRWTAVAIGFAGMLIVIRPGMGVFHPAIFLIVVAAAAFAVRQILSRYLSTGDSTATTVAYTALTMFVLSGLALPFVWVTPSTWTQLLMIVAIAVLGAAGELMIIRALTIAQAVVLAPVHYSLILWSTLYGALIFNQVPDQWTLLGCAVIMVSGLYTLNRERIAAKRLRSRVRTD